jgi:hypothetical protein
MKKKRKIILACFLILAFITLGFLSNYISAPACQKKTMKELSQIVQDQSISKGKSIVWIDEERVISYSCEEIWGKSCDFEFLSISMPMPWFFPFQYNYRPEPLSIEYFEGDGSNPYAYIKTRKWDLPFVITEHYGLMAGTLWGRGGAKYFLGLFGLVLEVKDIDLWKS